MRVVYTVIGLLVLLGGLGAVKADQIGSLIAFGETAKKNGPPPETIAAREVATQPIQRTYDAVGSVRSGQGITVTTEVAGTVSRLSFDSGDTVEAGDVLLRLDTRVERAQLAQAQARLSLAEASLARTRALVPQGVESESVLDADASTLAAAKAEVAALRAQLAKKTIRAPFDGTLGIRLVEKGQYITPGTPLTMLEGAASTYVDFTLPQERLSDLSLGMEIRVEVDAGVRTDVLEGTLSAIEPSLQQATRSIQLRASVPEDKRLAPGMFVNVSVVVGEPRPRVMVPQTAVVRASYGASVFIVEPKPEDEPGLRETSDGYTVERARQQFVSLGETRGDFVAVLDGLDEGARVVTAGAFKLRNGAPIVVNNDGAPEPKAEPEVENR